MTKLEVFILGLLILCVAAFAIFGCAAATPAVGNARDVVQTTQQGAANVSYASEFGLGAALITGSAMVLLMIENWLITLLSHRREMTRLKKDR